MASESGFTTQKKVGGAQHKTIHNLGSDRYGTSVTSKSLSEVNAVAADIVNSVASPDNNFVFIEITGHLARKGDVLRMSSGALVGYEFEIVDIVDADIFSIINAADSIPLNTDTAKIMRWVTNKTDSEGNVNFSPGPTQYVLNGSAQQVVESTATPANNRALPSQLMIYKDGVQLPINKSSSVAAETVAVPVEIVGASGAVITITAGDINVQLSDQGANPDITRIGNGTNQLGINSSLEALVHDADSLVQISAINTKTPALVGGMVPVNTGLVQGLTDTQIRATALPVSGPLTDAQLRATPVPISGSITTSGLNNTELRATPVPISGALTDAQIRATALPISGSVSLASAIPTGANVIGALAANQSVNAAQINGVTPLMGNGATGTGSLRVTIASDNTVIPVAQAAQVGSFQEILNLTNSAQTFTAPANSKWCKVYADDTNTVNIRVKIGAAATVSSGVQFQPGRSEDFQVGGNVSVIAESAASNQKINVTFGV